MTLLKPYPRLSMLGLKSFTATLLAAALVEGCLISYKVSNLTNTFKIEIEGRILACISFFDTETLLESSKCWYLQRFQLGNSARS